MDWENVSKFSKAEDSTGFLLWKVYGKWRQRIDEALYPLGLTHMQFVILASTTFLYKKGSLLSQVNLSKFIGCDVNVVSKVVRNLEKRGHIKRVNKDGDEKTKYPKPTKQGEETASKAIPLVEAVDEEFFNYLNTKDFNADLVKLSS